MFGSKLIFMANLNKFALIVRYLYFLLNPMLAFFLNLKGGCSLSFHKENYLADFHFMFVSADVARQVGTRSVNYFL